MIGEAEVLKVFKLTGAKSAAVGGCRVKQGKMIRKSTFRVIRGDEVDYSHTLLEFYFNLKLKVWLGGCTHVHGNLTAIIFFLFAEH